VSCSGVRAAQMAPAYFRVSRRNFRSTVLIKLAPSKPEDLALSVRLPWKNDTVADEFGSSAESLTPEPRSAGLDTDTDTVADDLESTAATSTPEHRGAPPELDTDTDTVADDLESTAATSTPEHRGAPPELDTDSDTVADEVGSSPE
jgi:hypothetical protein